MTRFASCALALALVACATRAPDSFAQHDPARLVGPTWAWVGTHYSDDRRVNAPDPARFTLAFQADGRVEVRADCNRGGATYTADPHRIGFGPVALTKKRCDSGSPDREFLRGLDIANGWLLRDGELFVTLRYDTGSMRFIPLKP